ncbi:PQQ-dependent sugar dehydrogenase [Aestuariibius sp. 2305UL40-4]|uniref:PQQ-dependent sugar dehydrogenase n=1 Tax=Aestuariibius violaceus TaxID=3234132 RepID=UPI00345E1AAE
MLRLTSILAVILIPSCALTQTSGDPVTQGDPNVPEFEPAFENQTRAPAMSSGEEFEQSVLAGPLEHPWGIAELPDGSFLVTERPGRMRMIAADGSLSEPIAGVPEVLNRGQGGLLDVNISPDFASDRMVYWTYAKPLGGGMSVTAAARGVLSEDGTSLSGVEDIFVQEPPSPTPMHYGSRIVFDGDGFAFITTGEHSAREERTQAQDLNTTYGKVIRVRPDGSVPDDNPFVGQDGAIDTIWAYGLRNPQGADIHPRTGALWTLEHGPRGGDELNQPEPGRNYGWPVITYGEEYSGAAIGASQTQAEGMEQPVYYWDPVIAPGGFIFYDGDAFPEWQGDVLAGSLYPGGLVRLEMDGDRVVGEERLVRDIGRVRDVEQTSDGRVLLLTDEPNGEVIVLAPAGPS